MTGDLRRCVVFGCIIHALVDGIAPGGLFS